jgi:serine-type D-Ala-D-Ala carboxypeptidase
MKPICALMHLAMLSFLISGCRMDGRYRRDERFAPIDDVTTEEIEAGHVPGAVILVGQGDRILYWEAFGAAVREPYLVPMTKETVFDLASLTKPIATATSILVLVDRGRLDLDDAVGKYLPAFACNGKEDARIRHLLTHTSGLPAYTSAAALEGEHGRPCPDKVIEKICSLTAMSPPGEKFRYSCLGYITLAQIVRVVTGQDIDAFSRQNIYEPLGMMRTSFNPPASWQADTAATTVVDGQPLRGTVHDPLAQLMDGLGGNAGLFSSAADLALYCQMLLNGGTLNGQRILSPEAVALLTSPQSHGRAFGFDVSSGYAWVKGPHASERAFCHTGYTGTSLVCDPASNAYLILLTNRVHPSDKGRSKPIREKTAEIVFGILAP